MIGAGVPFCPARICQVTNSYPGTPASAIVGICGAAGLRLVAVMPAYGEALSSQEAWHIVNFLRSIAQK